MKKCSGRRGHVRTRTQKGAFIGQSPAASLRVGSESNLVINLQQVMSLTTKPAPGEERRRTDLTKTVTKELQTRSSSL